MHMHSFRFHAYAQFRITVSSCQDKPFSPAYSSLREHTLHKSSLQVTLDRFCLNTIFKS